MIGLFGILPDPGEFVGEAGSDWPSLISEKLLLLPSEWPFAFRWLNLIFLRGAMATS